MSTVPAAAGPLSTVESPLPPLPSPLSALFDAWLAGHGDLAAIAARLEKPAHEILRALLAAPLRDYIAQASALRAESLRNRSLATLDHVQQTAEHIPERRRAATCIVRALDGIPSPFAPLAFGAGERDRAQRIIQPRPFEPKYYAPAAAKPRFAPDPLARPAPELDAPKALSRVMHALRQSEDKHQDAGLVTLHAFLAPTGELFGSPVPRNPADFAGSVRSIKPGRDGAPHASPEPFAPVLDLADHVQCLNVETLQATDSVFDARVRLIRPGGRYAPFIVRLQRHAAPPFSGNWLITGIIREARRDTS